MYRINEIEALESDDRIINYVGLPRPQVRWSPMQIVLIQNYATRT